MYLNSILLVLLFVFPPGDSFKDQQRKYPRVRQAYKEKEQVVNNILDRNAIKPNALRIYLRAFKRDKKIELWAKNETDDQYKKIRDYNICRLSGQLGPKRRRGDYQIPEGFYHIDRFNPHSSFYLSLGLNYPNTSDRILGVKDNLGGDIFIHGACVTIGCLPITDNVIKELYVFCVEAKNSGQDKIPVTVFPTELGDTNYRSLVQQYEPSKDKAGLWADLKQAYDHFNQSKQLPSIVFLSNGRHKVSL
ncbi:MAG: hypothetical protein MJA30_14860 [Cytophagales bacterium]|nr:hypothetical protein [Cytophagales bacterium]